MNYWAVGATHGETDVSKEFLEKNIWYDGYAEDGDVRDKNTLEEVEVGDILLMKSSSTKGPNHSITFTKLKGIGKIIEKEDYYSFKVEWIKIKDLPLDFNGISYRKTIESAREDEMLNYAKFIMEKEIPKEARVIYSFLVKSMSHRNIQIEVLGEEAPPRGGGFSTMTILHDYEIKGDKKGVLKHTKIEDEIKTATAKYSEALQLIKRYYPELTSDNPSSQTMNMAKNIILYGPPGTGKTYESIDYAVKIATGESAEEHSENKDIFDELRQQGQIEFVTFHQNYSYEDFVVGIKPDVEFEQLRFKTQKGIFYEIAKRARENYFASIQGRSLSKGFEDVLSEIVKPLVEKGEDIEIKMTSGIVYKINDITENTIHFKKSKGDSRHSLSIQTIENIVEGRRKSPRGLEPYYEPLVEKIKEMMKPIEGTKTEILKNYVLIIDEINRANISKVFGELITLLEDDKRLGEENELKVSLPNGEKEFGVPPNLFIIGTMNTADKSIALIDIALRRRFEFIGFYPKYEGYNNDAIELLKKINSAIFETKKKSADYLIGHAYFMNHQPIETILKNKVVPLLMEYFSGKSEIVTGIFEGTEWNVNYNCNNYSWDISRK